MKRTGFIWFMIVVMVLDLLITLSSFFITIPGTEYSGNATMGVIGTVLSVVYIIVAIIYIYKLLKVTRDLIKWTNVAFIFGVITFIFSSVSIYINSGGTNPSPAIVSNIVVLVMVTMVWLFFVKHLKKVFSGV